jgi:hypothetical protein
MKKNKQKKYLTLGLLGAMASLPLMGMTSASAMGTSTSQGVKATSSIHRYRSSKNGNQTGIFKGKGVIGTITQISETSIMLKNRAGVMYTVDASKATVEKNGSVSTLADLLVGDMIMAQGTVTGMSVSATAIHDGIKAGKGVTPGEMAYKPMVAGIVASISGNTLTVTGKNAVVYTVDGTTAKVMKSILGKKPTTGVIADITVGDTVRVQGTLTGTNMVATTIIDGVLPERSVAKTTRTRSTKTAAAQ